MLSCLIIVLEKKTKPVAHFFHDLLINCLIAMNYYLIVCIWYSLYLPNLPYRRSTSILLFSLRKKKLLPFPNFNKKGGHFLFGLKCWFMIQFFLLFPCLFRKSLGKMRPVDGSLIPELSRRTKLIHLTSGEQI